jgi:hypothetical protein
MILTPIFILGGMAFSFSKPSSKGDKEFIFWLIPLLVGSIYGLFTFFRLVLILESGTLDCYLEKSDFDFLFSEIFNVGIFYVSVITIPPAFIFPQFLTWIVLSVFIYFRYQARIGLA